MFVPEISRVSQLSYKSIIILSVNELTFLIECNNLTKS